VANFLSREKQIQVLRLLSEGNSIRSTVRLTGIHKSTIMRFVVRFGNACRDFLDESLANLSLRHVQCDEIWTFVPKKEGHLYGNEKRDDTIGDIYLYTALDTDTKLLVTFAVGKRNSQVTEMFIGDLEKRLVRQPEADADDISQISTDGWPAYPGAIARKFGRSVRHGVLIKELRQPGERPIRSA
jgi:IS1 family transposase